MTAPLYPPPPYMPPPYPTGSVMYPQPVPVPVSFIPPNLPPEEASISKTEEPSPDPAAVFPPEEHQMIVSCVSFEDDTVQKAFIRKVFSVVTIQLLVTFTVVCVFTFSKTVKTAVQGNFWVYLSSYIIFAVVGTCLAVFSTFSRTHPWNLLGLVW